MTQEDKDLLLRDLCARLPYGVKVQYHHIQEIITNILIDINMFGRGNLFGHVKDICDIKPYLFPISSMTEEQKYICPIGVGNLETFIEKESWAYLELSFDSILRFIDWLNKNHFDYRGLIPMGLAIDCTNLNVY